MNELIRDYGDLLQAVVQSKKDAAEKAVREREERDRLDKARAEEKLAPVMRALVQMLEKFPGRFSVGWRGTRALQLQIGNHFSRYVISFPGRLVLATGSFTKPCPHEVLVNVPDNQPEDLLPHLIELLSSHLS